MQSNGSRCGWMTAGAVVALIALAGCGKRSERGESVAEIQAREGVPVSVVSAAAGPLRSLERAGGTVEGYAQAELSAGVPGTLTKLSARVGARVKKGALLAVVDPDYGSSYEAAKAQYETVVKSKERVDALAEQGGVSQQQVEELAVAVKGAKVGFEAARNSEHIYAPFAGTVVETMVPINSKVGPGQSLVKLAALDRVRIPVSVNESLIGQFARGQKAFVVLEGDTAYGTVEKVALGATEKGHMFPVDVVFRNPAGRFRTGMFVTVHVVTVEMPQALSVPAEVVLYDDEGAYVYVVDGGVARKARLEVGIRGEDRLSVNAGLAEGELVVATGASLLSDGVKVKVVEQS